VRRRHDPAHSRGVLARENCVETPGAVADVTVRPLDRTRVMRIVLIGVHSIIH